VSRPLICEPRKVVGDLVKYPDIEAVRLRIRDVTVITGVFVAQHVDDGTVIVRRGLKVEFGFTVAC